MNADREKALESLLYGVKGEEWPRWLGHLPWDVRAYYRRVVERVRASGGSGEVPAPDDFLKRLERLIVDELAAGPAIGLSEKDGYAWLAECIASKVKVPAGLTPAEAYVLVHGVLDAAEALHDQAMAKLRALADLRGQGEDQ